MKKIYMTSSSDVQGQMVTGSVVPGKEEVSVVEKYPHQHILGKIFKPFDQRAKGESNQTVYNKEKIRFINRQYIWYILIVIEILLMFRLILKLSEADPTFGFPVIIYTITDPFVYPFSNISGNFTNDGWATIFAGIVYLCIAWGIIYLLHLVNPITPRDLEYK